MKTIEEILKTDDAHREQVPMPEWNDTITVVSMSAEERSDIERVFSGRNSAQSNPGGFRAAVLERSIKKSDGTPWATAEQIKQLMKKNTVPVERLFETACRVSGFSKQDVKELEKN